VDLDTHGREVEVVTCGLGEATRRLIGDLGIVDRVASQFADGSDRADVTWRLLELARGDEGRAPHRQAPIVGRAAELDLLRTVFHRTVHERTATLFTVIGERGISGSRDWPWSSRTHLSVRPYPDRPVSWSGIWPDLPRQQCCSCAWRDPSLQTSAGPGSRIEASFSSRSVGTRAAISSPTGRRVQCFRRKQCSGSWTWPRATRCSSSRCLRRSRGNAGCLFRRLCRHYSLLASTGSILLSGTACDAPRWPDRSSRCRPSRPLSRRRRAPSSTYCRLSKQRS
jgi:hypothetical protein